MAAFSGWENFYVIVGSSAGALIGLQFVVITLIAERASRVDPQAGSAFATPSVIHFGVVLLLSAILSAPWNTVISPALLWGLIGLCGVIYTISVVQRLRKQTAYRPVFEDWLFHALLPLFAYGTLIISAFMAQSRTRPALFLVGATSLLLLFVGIHNAWDAVTYHIYSNSKGQLS
ncbi:MAG TPA: hypothetical protein VH815_15770 [Acidobacteriota bacterium]|jgi:hypothetical protein